MRQDRKQEIVRIANKIINELAANGLSICVMKNTATEETVVGVMDHETGTMVPFTTADGTEQLN